MAENLNRDSYQNIKGTTCKSFKIGKTSISFSSSAVNFADKKITTDKVSKYRNLVTVVGDNGQKVIYDSEIPLNAVKCVKENGNTYTIVLMDGTEIPLSGNVSGVQYSSTEGRGVEKTIAIYNDTTGAVITNSGFKIITESDLPTADELEEGIEKLNELSRLYKEKESEFKDSVPTMTAVMQYVGTIDSVLNARLNGNLSL